MIIDLAGVRATAAKLRIPQVGVWIADVDFDGAQPLPTGRLTLTIGAAAFVGTVDPKFSGTFAGRRRVRFVAGANGWGSVVGQRFFHNDAGVRDKTVIDATAAECGEVVSFNTTPTAAGRVAYTRQRGVASAVLTKLATAGWYVDYAGVTQIGPRVVAKLGKFDLLAFDPGQNIATIATTDIQAVGIGATLTENLDRPLVVRDLTIDVSGDGARTFAWGTTT